jgi:hypothetical protein
LFSLAATDKIVITNCQSTDVDSGKVVALEQLLLQVKSNFDELSSEVQSLKHDEPSTGNDWQLEKRPTSSTRNYLVT